MSIPMQPKQLSEYELTLLRALLAQQEPVTRVALVGWHLGKDADPDDILAGFEVIDTLALCGYVEVDCEYVSLTKEQRDALALRISDLAPAFQGVLRVLFDSAAPLRAGDVGNRLPQSFVDLMDEGMKNTMKSVSVAYAIAIYLGKLVDLGYVCKKDNRYHLSLAQKAMLRGRFPEWAAAVPAASPPSQVVIGHARNGRAVELD